MNNASMNALNSLPAALDVRAWKQAVWLYSDLSLALSCEFCVLMR